MRNHMEKTLTQAQVIKFNRWSESFERSVYAHKDLHNLLNLIVLFGCLFVWIRITLIQAPVLLGCFYFLSAVLSGIMTYSLMIFSYNEGLNNDQIFLGNTHLIRFFRYLSSSLYKFAVMIPALVIFKHSELHSVSERALYIVIVFFVTYVLDTLRKYVEYNLLPNGENTLRSLGTGIWAILVVEADHGATMHSYSASLPKSSLVWKNHRASQTK